MPWAGVSVSSHPLVLVAHETARGVGDEVRKMPVQCLVLLPLGALQRLRNSLYSPEALLNSNGGQGLHNRLSVSQGD